MEYRTLGGTGHEVSPSTLGASPFGAVGNPDRIESIRITHRAPNAGINVIGTAGRCSHAGSGEIVAGPERSRANHARRHPNAPAAADQTPRDRADSTRTLGKDST